MTAVQLFKATETATVTGTTADEGCAWQLMLYVDSGVGGVLLDKIERAHI